VRAIASVRERITSPEAQDLFKRWFDASPFYSGTVVANRLGWQVGRTLAKEVSLRLRQVPAGPALPTTLADALERDGIVVIPNYLSSEDAARVRAAHRHYGSSPHVRDIGQENESRITFRTGRVARDSPGDDGDLLLRLFGADPLMIALAEQVIRRRITPPLPLVYQHLEVPDHVLDSYDRSPYSPQPGAIPFIDLDNRFVLIGASYDPAVLEGKSVTQIARALSHPSSPIAQDVDGTANLLVAAISHATGIQPNP